MTVLDPPALCSTQGRQITGLWEWWALVVCAVYVGLCRALVLATHACRMLGMLPTMHQALAGPINPAGCCQPAGMRSCMPALRNPMLMQSPCKPSL